MCLHFIPLTEKERKKCNSSVSTAVFLCFNMDILISHLSFTQELLSSGGEWHVPEGHPAFLTLVVPGIKQTLLLSCIICGVKKDK